MKTEIFENPLQTGRNLKMPAFCFRVDGKHFENVALRKIWRYDNHVVFKKQIQNDQWLLRFQSFSAYYEKKNIDVG